jgi:precorrin-6B methylase 1
MDRPSLIVVGTGIRVVGQMTTEAIAWIRLADKVLYLVNDLVAEEVLTSWNPSAESMAGLYAEGKPRKQTYREMVDRVLECVRSGQKTCLVFYGHPGVFCRPGHEAIRLARSEGYSARMLPAVSALDCLIADLGLDPSTHGCQSYEATDFLLRNRHADPASLLILWQIGTVGNLLYRSQGCDLTALPILVERLVHVYGGDHTGILYSAPIQWGGEPSIQRVRLAKLGKARIYTSSTLCVPPCQLSQPDLEMYERLNLKPPQDGQPSLPRRARKKRTLSGRLSGKSSPGGSRGS